MSNVQEQIKAAKEKHDTELKALQDKADRENAELEKKRLAELDDIAKNGRNKAIEELVSLDTTGSMYVIDRKPVNGGEKGETYNAVLVIAGDRKFELKVTEKFEKTGMWCRKTRGESKGIWYELCHYDNGRGFVDKSYNWKKASTAHTRIAELINIYISSKASEEKRKTSLASAIEKLGFDYPECDVEEGFSGVVDISHKSGANASFSVSGDVIKLEKLYIHDMTKEDQMLVIDSIFEGEKA